MVCIEYNACMHIPKYITCPVAYVKIACALNLPHIITKFKIHVNVFYWVNEHICAGRLAKKTAKRRIKHQNQWLPWVKQFRVASQTHSDETWVSSGSAGWLVEVGWTNRKHGPDYIQSWSHEVNTSKTGWQEEWDSSSENKYRMTIPFMKKEGSDPALSRLDRPTDLSICLADMGLALCQNKGSMVERLKPAGHPRIMRKGYGWLLPGI